MKTYILTLLSVLPLFALAQRGSYVLKLSSVDIEGESKGTIKIDSVKPSKIVVYKSNYTDSLIDIVFTDNGESIPFELTNKAEKNIKVNWNEASYIDFSNTKGKIMHVGVEYIIRSGDYPPTSIAGGSKISDFATPTDNVFYSLGYYGGWRTKHLLPYSNPNGAKTLVGKRVKLLLPIQNDGKQLDYVFTFDIVFSPVVN